ncbi:hypothetical protein PC112_g20071 [Phytophthora cactorum]|nr:hypothetical protein PC112_g20071 [Phytophthora cactorum]
MEISDLLSADTAGGGDWEFELSDTEEDLDYAANDEEDPGTESGEATTPASEDSPQT